jgi:hypothetical protein
MSQNTGEKRNLFRTDFTFIITSISVIVSILGGTIKVIYDINDRRSDAMVIAFNNELGNKDKIIVQLEDSLNLLMAQMAPIDRTVNLNEGMNKRQIRAVLP